MLRPIQGEAAVLEKVCWLALRGVEKILPNKGSEFTAAAVQAMYFSKKIEETVHEPMENFTYRVLARDLEENLRVMNAQIEGREVRAYRYPSSKAANLLTLRGFYKLWERDLFDMGLDKTANDVARASANLDKYLSDMGVDGRSFWFHEIGMAVKGPSPSPLLATRMKEVLNYAHSLASQSLSAQEFGEKMHAARLLIVAARQVFEKNGLKADQEAMDQLLTGLARFQRSFRR